MSEAKEEKKKGGKMPLIIAGVLVIGLVAGVAVMKMGGGKAEKKEEVHYELGETLMLEEFLVNLKGDHYLRTTIGLGLREGISPEEFKENNAHIRNAIVMTISGRSMEELASAKGKTELAELIKERVNAVLAGEEVDFTETGKSHGKKEEAKDGHGEKKDDKHSDEKSDEKEEKGKKEEKEEEGPHVLEVYYSSFAMQ